MNRHILDKYGNVASVIGSGGRVMRSSLYTTPQQRSYQYKQYSNVWHDNNQSIQDLYRSYDRKTIQSVSKFLYANSPTIANIINYKARTSFGEGIVVTPAEQDNMEWSVATKTFLENRWFRNNINNQIDYHDLQLMRSRMLDTVGEYATLKVKYNGYPLLLPIDPSWQIGCRKYNEKVVDSGRFAGKPIIDGVILSNNKQQVIGYRLLGATKEEDQDYSSNELSLVFEPQYPGQLRGIPRLASCIAAVLDQTELKDNLLKQAKHDSILPVIQTNKSGPDKIKVNVDPNNPDYFGTDIEDTTETGHPTKKLIKPDFEVFEAGMIQYLESETGEFRIPEMKRFSNVTLDFIKEIEKDPFHALDIPYELINTQAITSTNVRSIQNIARRVISERQGFIEYTMLSEIPWAVGVLMNIQLLPDNFDGNWYQYFLRRPAPPTVDLEREWRIDNEQLDKGLVTQDELLVKYGRDPIEIRTRTNKERTDKILDDIAIAKDVYRQANGREYAGDISMDFISGNLHSPNTTISIEEEENENGNSE